MKLWKYVFLLSVCVACSDFFPREAVRVQDKTGKRTAPPVTEKPTIDPQACAYGAADTTDSAQRLIWGLGTKSICPSVRTFRHHVAQMRVSVGQLCADPDFAAYEDDLVQQWNSTVAVFSRLNGNSLGPLRELIGESKSTPLLEMYSWPMDNKFAVYAELIKAHQQKSDYSSRLIAARKGLSAVETLIFDRQALVRPGLSGELKPNEIEFNALSLGERRAARCLVLRSLLGDVAFYAEDVYQKWSFNGGRYPIRVLERMRAGQTPMVLNDLSNGIYYLEKVKDFKLGTPLGLNARCLKAKCPDDVEFLKSGQGLIALRENIASFSLAMVGGDQQPGFLTLVEERGRADLAQTLRARIGNMNQTLAELMLTRKSLRELVVDADKSRCADVASPNALCRLYFEVAETMKIYKSDFMTVMNLAMPEGETDND